MISNFEQKKQNLLKAFDLLEDYGFLNKDDKEKKENIEKHKTNLIEQRFTLSVCGQINSGKSTLLNCLLLRKK